MIWNEDTEKTTGIVREEKYGRSKITYVDIVRCKDCENNPSNGAMAELLPYYLPCKSIPREDNYYCADGKRKDS